MKALISASLILTDDEVDWRTKNECQVLVTLEREQRTRNSVFPASWTIETSPKRFMNSVSERRPTALADVGVSRVFCIFIFLFIVVSRDIMWTVDYVENYYAGNKSSTCHL
jgi:hypothetical protein